MYLHLLSVYHMSYTMLSDITFSHNKQSIIVIPAINNKNKAGKFK